MATKAGRSLFSLPNPYETQAPMLGRPANWAPVWKNVIAGSWLIASVCIVLMKHNSSAIPAMWGISSLTQAPLLPCRSKRYMEGATGRLV